MSVRNQERGRRDSDLRGDSNRGVCDRDRDRDDQGGRREQRRVDDDVVRSRRKLSRSRSLQNRRSRSRSLKLESRCYSRSPPLQRRRRRRSCSRSLHAERRRRRSRSRSWSEYQRRRDASRERQRAEDLLAREKAREARAAERAEKEPSETILVHGIPDSGVAEDQLESACWSHAVQAGCSMPDAVHFAYDRSTQEFRGFATVEFPHKDVAKLFKEHANGVLVVEESECTLKYHHTTEPSRSPERPERRDRDEATVTIFVKGLATSTSEANIIDAFQPFATVKHIRHFPRRGFAFVQFHTIEDSTVALHGFETGSRNIIDGQRVVANFAQERADARATGAVLGNQVQSQVALQALTIASAEGDELLARMQQQQVQQANAEKALGGVNADMWANYMQSAAKTETVQSTNTFKHDPKSGFYLDEKAGLYYDPNTTYFFTMDYRKYFVYDSAVELLCEIDFTGKKVPKGERRTLPSQVAKARDNRDRAGVSRGGQQKRRSRSRESPRKLQRSRSRGRANKPWDYDVKKALHAAANKAADNGIRHGEFRPIYFKGGDPLACLAPAPAPCITPKAEPKKKKKGQEEVLGLAPMPKTDILNRPGHVTLMSGPRPGPVQVPSRSPSMIDAQFHPSPSMDFCPPAAAMQPSATVTPGDWICDICMRKFSCEEMLRKHELMSDLHKQNLAKLNGDV